jgi:hypothetical protein
MAFAAGQHALFDRVGDVRNNLNGGAQIVAATLFAQDVRVNTPVVKLLRRVILVRMKRS